MTDKMKVLSDRLQATFQGNDREERATLFCDEPSYISGGPIRGSRYTAKKAVLDTFERASTVFQVDRSDMELLLAENHFIWKMHVEGNSKVTARPYANDLLFIFEVRNVKIRSVREYMDTIATARACGDLPYPR
jgi:ketosteroid isomerase-like protein